jgi:hypothetical protein
VVDIALAAKVGTPHAIALSIGAGWSGRQIAQGNCTMFVRLNQLHQNVASLAGAFIFAALMISAAVPVSPIA